VGKGEAKSERGGEIVYTRAEYLVKQGSKGKGREEELEQSRVPVRKAKSTASVKYLSIMQNEA
jgi:hypothetical protein